jgi:hypothetical protein
MGNSRLGISFEFPSDMLSLRVVVGLLLLIGIRTLVVVIDIGGASACHGEVVERGDDVADAGAHGGVLLEAHGSDGERLVEALGGVVALEHRVGHLGEPALVLEARPRPEHEVVLVRWPGRVDGAAAGDDLEEDDAEAVDVGHGGELAGERVLGRAVAVGAHDTRGDVGLVAGGADLGEPEVGEARAEAGVEEDVGGLEVAVDHGRLRGVVQVLEPPRGALRDAHARGPLQRRAPRGQVQQVVLQGPQRHVLVDQHAVVGVGAEAQQRHQVGVLEQAQHQRLHQELARALHAVAVQLLDGHLRARRLGGQPPAVHGAEAALAQQRLRPEAAGGLGQLRVREGARRHLAGLAHLEDLIGHALVAVTHCITDSQSHIVAIRTDDDHH